MRYEMVVDINAKMAIGDEDGDIFAEWTPEQRAERIDAVKADIVEEIRREFGMADDDPLEVSIEVREVGE